jgi:hypothetical protein
MISGAATQKSVVASSGRYERSVKQSGNPLIPPDLLLAITIHYGELKHGYFLKYL